MLFETYHHRIYSYVLGLVKNPAEAEDLAQDPLFPLIVRDSLRDSRSRSRPGQC